MLVLVLSANCQAARCPVECTFHACQQIMVPPHRSSATRWNHKYGGSILSVGDLPRDGDTACCYTIEMKRQPDSSSAFTANEFSLFDVYYISVMFPLYNSVFIPLCRSPSTRWHSPPTGSTSPPAPSTSACTYGTRPPADSSTATAAQGRSKPSVGLSTFSWGFPDFDGYLGI